MRRLILLFSLLLVVLFSACSANETTSSASATTEATTETVTQATTEDITESTESFPVTIEANIYTKGYEYKYKNSISGEKIIGTLNVAIPEMISQEYADNAEMFNQYFQNLADKLAESFDEELIDTAENESASATVGGEWYRDLNYSIEYMDDNMVSVLITTTAYNGGAAHDNVQLESLTYDFVQGFRIDGSNIFWNEDQTEAIKALIIEKMDENPDMYYPNYADLVDSTFDKNNFVFTEDGLRIFFQTYDLAPYAAGIITFDISNEELNEIYGENGEFAENGEYNAEKE